MTTTDNANNIPTIETERLVLRRMTMADLQDLFEIRSDTEVMRYIPRPLAKSLDDVADLVKMLNDFADKNERLNWGITLKDSGKLIGIIGYVSILRDHFRAEIGYTLAKQYHRKGFMREALLKMIDYGFKEMNLHSILAIIHADNNASGALLEDVGFTKEAYYRDDFYYNGSFRNSIHYSLLETDPIKKS